MPRRRYEVRVEMAGLFNMLREVKVQFGWGAGVWKEG